MTEQHFEELVNLYLDNEIGTLELGELKRAIRVNVLLRRKFERACELHQAARKALATRAENSVAGAEESPREGNRTVNSSPAPVSGMARTSSRSRGTSAMAGGAQVIQSKQTQAHRNASVPVLAERQLTKGAASEVDLGKIGLESSRESKSTGRARVFGFFDSPLGMLIGLLLLGLGATGLYFGLEFIQSVKDDEANALLIQRSDVNVDPKILREIGSSTTDKPSSASPNVPTARLDPAAQSSMPATSSAEANPNTSVSDVNSSTSSAALPAPANVSLPQPAQTDAALTAGNLPPATPAPVPDASGLTMTQDYWVKLSMPAIMPTAPAAPAASDNTEPANQTALPVMMP
jgi:hypothetical protein